MEQRRNNVWNVIKRKADISSIIYVNRYRCELCIWPWQEEGQKEKKYQVLYWFWSPEEWCCAKSQKRADGRINIHNGNNNNNNNNGNNYKEQAWLRASLPVLSLSPLQLIVVQLARCLRCSKQPQQTSKESQRIAENLKESITSNKIYFRFNNLEESQRNPNSI